MYKLNDCLGGSPIPRLENPDPTAYPYQKMKNDVPFGSNNGTPIGFENCGDFYYALVAVLDKAGIVPSNSPESVTTSQFRDALETLFLKVGTVKMVHGVESNPCWLLCDGSSFSPSTYPDLFTFLGDVSVTPDYRGRTPVGLSSGDADFGTIGQFGGSKTHTLTVDELAAHTHGTPAGLGPGSDDTLYDQYTAGSNVQGESKGSGSPHNNVQPYIVCNFYIKAK